jgi:hypothetical protein
MAFQMNCRCSSSGSVHLLSVQRDNEDARVSFHAGRAFFDLADRHGTLASVRRLSNAIASRRF